MLSGEHLSERATLAGSAIFSGLALVLLAKRRQHREVPVEAPWANEVGRWFNVQPVGA